MRLSEHFGRTLRDAPSDATLVSHALIVRAGLARPLAAGIWSYLPLGWQVIRKLEAILREEMDATGAQEMLMPVLHPAEGWEATGRRESFGEALQRATKREGRHFALGATREEVIAELARREVKSYKDLPHALYQIQTTVRDEPRAGGRLIRLREFLMKDAYSLHADGEDLDRYYQRVYRAYLNVFARCGLDVVPIEADTGLMGGNVSHEFVLPHPVGEDRFVCCEDCAYAANVETAAFARSSPAKAEMLPLEKVATPDCKTIADLCAFLGISPEQTLKAVFYTADPGQPSEQTLMVMVRGDLDVSEAKLLRAISSATLQAASENEIRQRLGAEPGYASPVGLRTRGQGSVLVMADTSLEGMANVVTGANEPGYHVVNANLGRDFDVSRMEDIAEAYEGAACPRCGGTLHAERAVELGHCFKLGTRYSEPVGVTYLDANGKSQPVVMGSYWIGLERLMAAVIESHHDALGIIWPREVAPYHVHLVAIPKDEATAQAAESMYADLCAAGIETLYDDRNLSPGVMFADADLIGVPLRITVSPRSLESGAIEAKWRATDERTIVPLGGVVQTITAMVAQREL